MLGNHRKATSATSLRPLPVPAEKAKPTSEGGGLLTPAEAAGRLGVGERVMERWRSTGDGPAYVKLTSRTLRYRAEDIEAFVTGNVRRNTAE
jgi:hypothetical protein